MTTIDLTQLSSEQLEAALAEKKQQEFEAEMNRKAENTKAEDLMVRSIIEETKKFHQDLKALKELQSEAIANHNKRLYQSQGKEVKEQKKSNYFTSDKKGKVVLEYADKLDFNSEAVVHINSIKDILRNKFGEDASGLYDFIDSILMKNTQGDYDPKLLTKAKQKATKFKDAGLMEEFKKLEDCRIVIGTSKYVRAYEKDENGKFQNITLNFSSL